MGSETSDDVAHEPDRDSWVTPKKTADELGEWDLDPCSNVRSHIKARRAFDLARGQDGLRLARFVSRSTRVFVNPPYSHGSVLPFVLAYRHTRFCFLVRFDVSTEWWAELWPWVSVAATFKERIAFEAPPGVEDPGSSPFPHVLLYRDARDVTEAIGRSCYLLARMNLDLSKGPTT